MQGTFTRVSELKQRLRDDLTAAMKARDELVKSTLRMTLTAIGNAEVAGTEARELSDDEVLKVIAKEAKKRAESAEAFTAGGRAELAAQELAEAEVLARYLPTQLTDDELAVIARSAVDETEAELGAKPGPRQMGQVMKKANAAAAGRADGGRVAAAVKALLA
ncbi:GatB/YqeY domain-containing protein [Pseudonocardia benzenivorans]